ncbi:MAG: ATPase [Catenulispora sp.]|nr:ATPase [Catenulispora sp.]
MSHPAGGRHRRLNPAAAPGRSAPGALVPTARPSKSGTSNTYTPKSQTSKPQTLKAQKATAEAAPATVPKSSASWRLRPRTVRAKIVALLAIPVVALMALWGLATVTEVRGAYAEQQVAALDKPVRAPMADAETALELERRAAVRLLTQPDPQPGSFTATAAATDTALAAVRTGTAAAAVPIGALAADLRTRVHAALTAFDTLPALRRQVASHTVAVADVFDAYDTAIDAARAVGDRLAQAKAADAPSSGTEAAAVLGLLAVVVSLPVSVRVGRGLVVELVGLRDDALDLAGRRLPAAIARLRAGDPVDLEQAAPRPASIGRSGGEGFEGGANGADGNSGARPGRAPSGAFDDEIGQVAEALAVVQRAALDAAVERAEMVSGVARIFLNLARRSQILVHRQLALLDAMERRVMDPAEVEDLFRLDHLATRMRRHAESLIILSGQAPGRGWRLPVPLLDVLRSAVAEVEDFARVDVRRVPAARVVGGAVADLTHLVAELVENATVFSPPDARITVRATSAEGRCVIEVEDAGLGMGPEALAKANARLADARASDMFDSDRLGLFVVSRLARRHGVTVLLSASPGGGTLAQVWLPVSVLEQAGQLEEPDQPEQLGRAEETGQVGQAGESFGFNGFDGHARPDRGSRTPDPVGSVDGWGQDPRAKRSRTDQRVPVTVGENGLPRRVRQSSLAPQLRGHRTATQVSGSDDRRVPESRSPDEVRATMAAFQNGWTLGRADADDDGPNGPNGPNSANGANDPNGANDRRGSG